VEKKKEKNPKLNAAGKSTGSKKREKSNWMKRQVQERERVFQRVKSGVQRKK